MRNMSIDDDQFCKKKFGTVDMASSKKVQKGYVCRGVITILKYIQ